MNVCETTRLNGVAASPHLIRAARALLEATVPLLRQAPGNLDLARDVLRRYPEHGPEIESAAQALHADPLDLTLGALSYDLLLGLYACSTAAVATDEGPVVARNMDWAPEDLIAKASCIIPTTNGHSAAFAGSTGVVTGLSRNGFAVVLNAVLGDRLDPDGYPMLLFLRHLVDHAADYDDALRLTTTTPLMSGGLITVVGRHNDQRAVVERAPSRAEVRTPRGSEPLVTTNDYHLLGCSGENCDRYQSLYQRARALPPLPDDLTLLGCLTRPPVFTEITAQHVVARPASGRLRMWVPGELLSERRHGGAEADWLRRLLG